MTNRITWACAIALLATACGGDAFTSSDFDVTEDGAVLEDGGSDALEDETGDGSAPVLEDGGELVDGANDDAADVLEDAAADSRNEWEEWGDAYIGLEGPCRPKKAPEELHQKTANWGMCWPDQCECAPGLRCEPINRPVEYMTKCLPPSSPCEWSRKEGARCWADCQCGPGLYCQGFSSVTYEGTCERP